MYKYLTKDDIKNVILSLNLIDGKIDDNKKLKLLYGLSNNIENNYTEHRIPKRNGDVRVLNEPNPLLKSVQRNILHNYLYEVKPSIYVKSYIRGLSLVDNANVHVSKKKILKLDIDDFFDHVSSSLVYSTIFGLDKFPKEIGILLTSLVCYYGSLPQGAPTSAYISNLVLRDFDYKIGEWAKSIGVDYTRYSDDMTFSGDFDPTLVIRMVRKELRHYDLNLNEDKIVVIDNSSRQMVTGVCVNEKLQASNPYRRKIRQEMYFIKRYGLDSHMKKIGLKDDKVHYLRSLYGKVLYVISLDKSNEEFKGYKSMIQELLNEEM